MKIDFKAIGGSIGNILKALGKGELLLRLRADKYYVHLLYIFLLAWLTIFISLRIDKTLLKMEQNKKTIEDMEIRNTQKRSALIEIKGISNVMKRLEEQGSTVAIPEESATIIKKRSGKTD